VDLVNLGVVLLSVRGQRKSQQQSAAPNQCRPCAGSYLFHAEALVGATSATSSPRLSQAAMRQYSVHSPAHKGGASQQDAHPDAFVTVPLGDVTLSYRPATNLWIGRVPVIVGRGIPQPIE